MSQDVFDSCDCWTVIKKWMHLLVFYRLEEFVDMELVWKILVVLLVVNCSVGTTKIWILWTSENLEGEELTTGWFISEYPNRQLWDENIAVSVLG